MLYSLTTTAKTVFGPRAHDTRVRFSASKFASSATTIYIRPTNTLHVWTTIYVYGTAPAAVNVPHGTQLEAYTDTGTAELTAMPWDEE